MSELDVRQERIGDVTVVSLRGEFDYAELGAVRDGLATAEADRPPTLLLDLTGLEFMDSSAVRVILQADSRARQQQRRLALVTGDGPPHRVLSLLGLLERLDIVDDRSAVLPGGAG